MCMYVVFCKIDHCIHMHWCIVMGLGHNDPWVESHMWPQQTWGQRSSRGQWPLVQVFGKKGQCIHILWCIFKSNITMIAKVCDRESRRDTWFENRLVCENLSCYTVKTTGQNSTPKGSFLTPLAESTMHRLKTGHLTRCSSYEFDPNCGWKWLYLGSKWLL